MIIGIDANEANVSRRVGVSEFAFELLTQLHHFNVPGADFNIYLKEQPHGDFPMERQNWKYTVFGPKKMWTQFALPVHLFLHRIKPQVFFTPSHYAPRFSSCPTVISIMDLAYVHFPELFAKKDLYQLKHWTRYSVRNASHVITISEASKRDILKIYEIPEHKVSVVYPGIRFMESLTPHVYPKVELKTKFGIHGKYILFTGTLQPRKNITRLIEAFSKVKATKKHDVQLIIVGRKGWLYEEILIAPDTYAVRNDVKFLDFVTDEDLGMLYDQAECFVLPSLYEGFGLPILEAMHHNCPVITSNISSMPEAGGDAAVYVDPLNVQDIADKIENVLSDKDLRKQMIAKGKKQVEKFSWEKSAKQTLTILQKIGTEYER